MSFTNDVRKLLRENIREYGMFIALFVIVAFFTITTDGLFLSPRNIVNLVNQTGYIAVLAIGMTLVIVIRHIDLSVGFLAGFLGAVAAIAMVSVEPSSNRGDTICPGFRYSGRASYLFHGRGSGNPRFCCHARRMVGLQRCLTACNQVYWHDHYSECRIQCYRQWLCSRDTI